MARARVRDLEGPRLPDGTYHPRPGSPYYTSGSAYAPGGAWAKRSKGKKKAKRASRKGYSTVTSKSGRTYKQTKSGSWSLVRGPKGKRGKRGRGRRGRR